MKKRKPMATPTVPPTNRKTKPKPMATKNRKPKPDRIPPWYEDPDYRAAARHTHKNQHRHKRAASILWLAVSILIVATIMEVAL